MHFFHHGQTCFISALHVNAADFLILGQLATISYIPRFPTVNSELRLILTRPYLVPSRCTSECRKPPSCPFSQFFLESESCLIVHYTLSHFKETFKISSYLKETEFDRDKSVSGVVENRCETLKRKSRRSSDVKPNGMQ